MADNQQNRVHGILLYLTGTYTLEAAYTDHSADLTYGGNTYSSAPEIDFSGVADLSIGMDSDECEVKNIPIDQTLTANIFNKYRYNEVGVKIFSWELDDTGAITGTTWTLWKGKLYSVKSLITREVIHIKSRNDKYYCDVPGGLLCIERCVVAYFGDSLCGVTVTNTNVTINSITGTLVTLDSAVSGTDKLYRSGSLSYQGLEIKVADWRSSQGDLLYMETSPPSDWEGETVVLSSGCDRTLDMCRNVHNNEANMLPLGYAMVDYNTYYEEE